MIALIGSVGWGLLACGAVTHVWHRDRLRELLALHLDHERLPAAGLTTLEVILAAAIPASWLAGIDVLVALAVLALALATVFVLWIGRLLLSGSTLPCACSFSAAPTSWWSFARAVAVMLVGLFAIAPPADGIAIGLGTLTVGWALAAAGFVLPEALSWPESSRALLARVEAHTAETAAS